MRLYKALYNNMKRSQSTQYNNTEHYFTKQISERPTLQQFQQEFKQKGAVFKHDQLEIVNHDRVET